MSGAASRIDTIRYNTIYTHSTHSLTARQHGTMEGRGPSFYDCAREKRLVDVVVVEIWICMYVCHDTIRYGYSWGVQELFILCTGVRRLSVS